MFESILKNLTIWRNEVARMEGVELFRVIPNKALEEIARARPRDKAQLTAIKGIKEAKFRKYGSEILRIVRETETGAPAAERQADRSDLNYFRQQHRRAAEKKPAEKIYSVGEYWDAVNGKLVEIKARIRGEISSVDIRSTAVYFSLKDKKDESVMNCFIFRYQYHILGVPLEEGMEAVVEGYPEVYKPYGRISLRTASIEPEGEGALKKEYEALRRKLEGEGFFAPEGKRALGRLPRTIGLITSRDGAAIGDFRSNIGRYGFRIKLIHSSVEGKKAVFELIDALRAFQRTEGLDAVVVIRGGGSLESLQAFNNEALIREAKQLGVPLICGVGHDRDVCLLALAADYAVSTPTAAAKLLGGMWESEIERLEQYERNLFLSFEEQLGARKYALEATMAGIEGNFQGILDGAEEKYEAFLSHAGDALTEGMRAAKERSRDLWKDIAHRLEIRLNDAVCALDTAENSLRLNDPGRQLRLGYGIVSLDGKSIRSIEKLKDDDTLKIILSDGQVKASVREIKKNKR